ncbi:hypothetical protein Cs7R123_13420 [Catellatospora sp. TT07R-123]|uniref:DUF3592 domain-containing protein n=1 Tax=Catellatospora sp. TT07R-123 TaxID=2733863 RepID=UPI001B235C0E|nr:DUF3592 domain-containing protein [Catellatospora sp. TT07R-123]GHJ44000.1 hypothetical protein Cs7R123_13420 [Catellatospora sp. TT07R-123]
MEFTGPFFALFFVVLLVIGGVVVWGAIQGSRKVARSQELREVGRVTTGTVVDNQMESHSHHHDGHHRTSITFRPVVRYRAQDGTEVTAVGPAASNRSFIVGSTVPLRVHPDRPEQIEITSGQGRGSGGVAGIVVGVIGVVVLVLMATFACSAQREFDDFRNDMGNSTDFDNGPFGNDPFGDFQQCTIDGQQVSCK